MEEVSELKEQLRGYEDQYKEVIATLRAAPDNEELLQLKTNLEEIISATKELLGLDKKQTIETAASPPTPSSSSNVPESTQIMEDPDLLAKFDIGTAVSARYSVDSQWYDAVINSYSIKDGSVFYNVTYVEYGNSEELAESEIREVAGSKRKRGSQNVPSKPTEVKEIPIPKHLKILPTDTEEARNMKRKKIHRIKSQNRLMKAEVARNQKQLEWKKFMKGGLKKKTGFFTGRKKDSIFKSPDSIEGKVGVVGSGQGLTHNPEKRPKYKEIFKQQAVMEETTSS